MAFLPVSIVITLLGDGSPCRNQHRHGHGGVHESSIYFRIGHGEEAPAGGGRGAGRREAEQLLQVGADADGAEEVEEDHGAVGGVVPGDATVAHALDERHRGEGQLGDGAALEEGVEQAEDDEEHGGHDGAGLELGERQLPRGVLEAGLDAVHLLGPRRGGARGLGGPGGAGAGGGGGRGVGGAGLHGVELAGVALDGGAEGVVGGGAAAATRRGTQRPRRRCGTLHLRRELAAAIWRRTSGSSAASAWSFCTNQLLLHVDICHVSGASTMLCISSGSPIVLSVGSLINIFLVSVNSSITCL